jgi:hypothetical protein
VLEGKKSVSYCRSADGADYITQETAGIKHTQTAFAGRFPTELPGFDLFELQP